MKRLALLVAALSASVAAAQPYEYLTYRMIADDAHPFAVYSDARSPTPAGIQFSAMDAAATRAWTSWNSVACASVKVAPRGASTTVPIPSPMSTVDAFSVTPVWMLNSSDPDFDALFGGSTYIAAISIPRAYSGVLETCDTFFNGVNFRWTTDSSPAADQMDIETVMLHEAGHCLGIGHLAQQLAVMELHVEPGEIQRVLTVDDTQALCQRYPNNGAVTSPCLGDGGCNSPTLKCLTHPATNGLTQQLCTRGCNINTGANCEMPTTCQASNAFASGGFTGACLMPGSQINDVGKACATGNDCGSAVALCRLPEAASGGQQLWRDGYCTQGCAAGDPACPAGSSCVTLDQGRQCAQSCRIGLADCRGEYACVPIDDIETTGVCLPKCYSDNDCAGAPGTVTCRTCDGICINAQNTSGQIGDVCTDSSTCGAGQSCRSTAISNTQKQCVQQCSRGCATCPPGSLCSPSERGELVCLKTCTGPGTCPIGLRCGDTTAGKACLPLCFDQSSCPVGQTCISGECYPPTPEDAGCGSICQKPDAGRPIVVTPRDAGTGGGGDGGCGCSTVDPMAAWLALGALIALRRKERR